MPSRFVALLAAGLAFGVAIGPVAAQHAGTGDRTGHPRPRPSGSPRPCPSLVPGWGGSVPYPSVTPMPGAAGYMPSAGGLTVAEIAALQAQGAALAAQQGLNTPFPGTTPPACMPPINGNLLERIWAAAVAFRFTPTAWPGTDCGGFIPPDHLGNCACAAAIQRVVFNATGVLIGSYNVDDFVRDMFSGRYGGGPVPLGMAHRGALIIWSSHIGICNTDGCQETLSNSSSHSMFAPYIGGAVWDGGAAGYEQPQFVWEPTHIP